MASQHKTSEQEKRLEAGLPASPGRERWRVQTFAAVSSSLSTGQQTAAACFGAVAVDHIQQGLGAVPATESQLTFFLTSHFLGLLLGSLVSGGLGQRFGSRNVMLATTPACLLGWVTLALAPSVPVMVVGRTLIGFSISLAISSNILFISGTCSARYRGLLSLAPDMLMGIAIIITFLVGKYLMWRHCAIALGVGFNVLMASLLAALPSDPIWLLGQGRLEEARHALLFYRGPDADVGQLSKCADDRLQDGPPPPVGERLRVLRQRHAYVPVLLTLVQFFANVWMGAAVIQNYAVIFIRRVGIVMEPFSLAIVIAASRLPVVLLSSLLIDRCGRRPLLLVSSLGMATCHVVMAAYFLSPALAAHPFVPVVCLFGAMAFFALGNSPVTWVLLGEMLPALLRELVGGWIVSFFALLTLAQLQLLPALMAALGEAGLFMFWAAVAVAHMLFVWLMLPETRGLRTEEIERLFLSQPLKNVTLLVTQVVHVPAEKELRLVDGAQERPQQV